MEISFVLNYRYSWVNPSNGRYYQAYITQDLLDDWLVVTLRSSQQRRYVQKSYVCTSYEEACKRLAKIKQARQWHGYQLA